MPLADATIPLQKAIRAWLLADPAVTAIVGDRVFDNVSVDAVKPYVSFGPFQVLPELADCSEGCEIFVTLDGWDASGGKTETVKKLGAAIVRLHNTDLTLGDGQRLVGIYLESTNYLRDPDNITTHAAIVLRALTEPLNP